MRRRGVSNSVEREELPSMYNMDNWHTYPYVQLPDRRIAALYGLYNDLQPTPQILAYPYPIIPLYTIIYHYTYYTLPIPVAFGYGDDHIALLSTPDQEFLRPLPRQQHQNHTGAVIIVCVFAWLVVGYLYADYLLNKLA